VLLIVFEIILASVPAFLNVGLVIAGGGGLAIMTWYSLVGRRLLQLGRL
jgi:hypothetical protein